MTLALVAHTIALSTDSKAVTTSAIDTTGAKVIVIITGDTGGGFAPTDSKSNSWISYSARTTGGITGRMHVASGPSLSVGTGHTFSHSSGSVVFPALAVMAFSASGLVIVEVENGAVNGSSTTSIATGSIAPRLDNSVLVMGLVPNFDITGLAITVGTIADSSSNSPTFAVGMASAYEIQTTKTTRNPSWSWTSAGNPVETTIGLIREYTQGPPSIFDPNTAYNPASYTLTNNNLTFHSTSTAADNGAFSSTFKTSGKWYLECSHINVGNNNSRIGLSGPLGVQQLADMWRNIGDHGLGSMPDSLAIDLDNMKVWGRIGAGNWNGNGSANPATNTLGATITAALANGCWFYVDSAQDSANPTWTVNFGATTFTQGIPTGFSPWDDSGVISFRSNKRSYRVR